MNDQTAKSDAGKATMAEIWAWAKQPEKEVDEC